LLEGVSFILDACDFELHKRVTSPRFDGCKAIVSIPVFNLFSYFRNNPNTNSILPISAHIWNYSQGGNQFKWLGLAWLGLAKYEWSQFTEQKWVEYTPKNSGL
jgi:hypothetical protein